MEILYSQRIEYSVITAYQNYSPINRSKDGRKFSLNVPLFDKGKKNTKYFYNDGTKPTINPPEEKDDVFGLSLSDLKSSSDNVSVPIYTPRLYGYGFGSTNKRHIKQHYGNPFSTISITLLERSIIKYENKITIKKYWSSKQRVANDKYFRKYINSETITIDLKTGNFTITYFKNNPRDKGKRFRVNNFSLLSELIGKSDGIFSYQINNINDNIREEHKKIFNDDEFMRECFNHLGFNTDVLDKLTLRKNIIDLFIKTRKIKIPNDYLNIILYYYPTEKYLKKNDRKLIASSLDRLGINSPTTVKLFHKYPHLNLGVLKKICNMFGDDYPKYINNVNPELFFNHIHQNDNVISKFFLNHAVLNDYYVHLYDNDNIDTINVIWDLTSKEKENIVILLKSITDIGSSSFLNTLRDHMKMLNALKEYYPNLGIYSTTRKNFMVEHSRVSKLFNRLKRASEIVMTFNEETIKTIEKSIKLKTIENDVDTIYPYLLKNQTEYIEEGDHMHHCVGSYIEGHNSIIISLRAERGKKRVTMEFHYDTGECVQAQYTSNQTPPELFNNPMSTIKKRVKKLVKSKKLKWEKKERIILENKPIQIVPIEEELVDNLWE